MAEVVDGARIAETWVNSILRVFSIVDMLLPMWADTTMRQMISSHDMAAQEMRLSRIPLDSTPPPPPSLADVYHRFVRMLLCDDVDLRIVNGNVFFMKNDVARAPLKMCTPQSTAALLGAWPLVFSRRMAVADDFDYTGCLHLHAVAQNFPRLILAARFMCIQIRIEVDECGDGVAAPYRLGAFYAFSSALSRLLVDERTRAAAATLYDVLINRRYRTLFDWHPTREPYPGHADDHRLAVEREKKKKSNPK